MCFLDFSFRNIFCVSVGKTLWKSQNVSPNGFPGETPPGASSGKRLGRADGTGGERLGRGREHRTKRGEPRRQAMKRIITICLIQMKETQTED